MVRQVSFQVPKLDINSGSDWSSVFNRKCAQHSKYLSCLIIKKKKKLFNLSYRPWLCLSSRLVKHTNLTNSCIMLIEHLD